MRAPASLRVLLFLGLLFLTSCAAPGPVQTVEAGQSGLQFIEFYSPL